MLHTIVLLLVAVHVLAGVFWAGSTFTLARTGSTLATALIRPQLGAAAATVLVGVGLWGLTHRYGFPPQARVLAVGALFALAALTVQASLVLPVARRMPATAPADPALQWRVATAQRVAAGLLAVTVICMVTARYF